MIIKSIHLENIRSHTETTVDMPQGSILLSGGIGSGKSTILLAIEFALFGIRRGELSGNALLRRGKKEGTVKLTFEVDDQEVTIERNLQRAGENVRQDTGSITIGGKRTDLTAMELKGKVLELLGYPIDLLQKQKSLIYRYTVYTPQEQTKQIIREDAESRLSSLRKAFGMERYSTIKENCSSFQRYLRKAGTKLEGISEGLVEKTDMRDEEQQEIDNLKQEVAALEKTESNLVDEKKALDQEYEQAKETLDEYKELAVNVKHWKKECASLEEEIRKDERELSIWKLELKRIEDLEPPTLMSVDEISELISEMQNRLEQHLRNPKGLSDEIDEMLGQRETVADELETIQEALNEKRPLLGTAQENLEKLNLAETRCPVCGSILDEEHREKAKREHRQEIQDLERRIGDLEKKKKEKIEDSETLGRQIEKEIEAAIEKLREEIDELRALREKQSSYVEEISLIEGYERQIGEKEKVLESKKSKHQNLEEEVEEAKKKLEKLSEISEREENLREELERIRGQISGTKEKIAEANTRVEILGEQLEELEREIKRKQKAKSLAGRLMEYNNWLGEYLAGLAGTIERNFMLQLQKKFEPIFAEWFNMLVDDELLDVRIGDDFSPIIEQEGYQAEYENLSGGEGASVALAYRLALNRLVNTMIEEINSRFANHMTSPP